MDAGKTTVENASFLACRNSLLTLSCAKSETTSFRKSSTCHALHRRANEFPNQKQGFVLHRVTEHQQLSQLFTRAFCGSCVARFSRCSRTAAAAASCRTADVVCRFARLLEVVLKRMRGPVRTRDVRLVRYSVQLNWRAFHSAPSPRIDYN